MEVSSGSLVHTCYRREWGSLNVDVIHLVKTMCLDNVLNVHVWTMY